MSKTNMKNRKIALEGILPILTKGIILGKMMTKDKETIPQTIEIGLIIKKWLINIFDHCIRAI